MKILYSLILYLFFFTQIAAANPAMILVGGSTSVSAADPCGVAAATYDLVWTGDHASGDTYFCYDNGDSNKNGTQSGGTIGSSYGEDGDGYQKTANNQYITVADGGDGIVQGTTLTQGTVWCSVYFPTSAPSEIVRIVEIVSTPTPGNNNVLCAVSGSATLYVVYEGQGAVRSHSGGLTISADTWTRVAWSWDVTNNAVSIVNSNGTWAEYANTVTAWNESLDDVVVGENYLGGGESTTVNIDNCLILPGYQTADPE